MTDVSELFQVTDPVIGCAWLLPEYFPIAVKVRVVPAWTLVVSLGETEIVILWSVPGVTVTVAEEEVTVPETAVTSAVQTLATGLAAVTRPVWAPIVAQFASLAGIDQLTLVVKFLVLPSS